MYYVSVLCLQNTLNPLLDKYFSGIKYLNVILKFFRHRIIILGALLGFYLFLCF